MAIALRPKRFVIFNGHVIINNGASDLTDLRESGPNEGEKFLHVMPVNFSNFFPWNFFYCFYNNNNKKKQPNATATCVILQMNLPQKNNEGFFNFEQVLKMTILKTKIAEC